MKRCSNCYYYDKCGKNSMQRCEFYDPIFGENKNVITEYEESLKERVEEYEELIEEQQG